MKKKRLTALIVSMALAITGVATGISTNKVKAADYGLSNPRVDSEGNVTWDCAYFGSYYQTLIEWTKEPIKWRVLSVDENNNALIVADKNLDCKKYDESGNDRTWETSTIRSWLNGYGADSNGNGVDYSTDNFIDEAFTEEEQAAINTTTVINKDNPSYGTEGGNNTEDKVYLLSIEEASNAEYGFDSTFDVRRETRKVKNTDYAHIKGVYTSSSINEFGNGYWWLRSPGDDSNHASCVDRYGSGSYGGDYVDHDEIGVRPALHINLSSSSVWTDAGVTDSEGNEGVSDNDINNPVVEDGVTTWDCIYFGSYNQTATWVKEPIKWRVLSVEGDDAFFVADKNLDCKKYNESNTDVTWETSTIRSWLNGYGADSNVASIDYATDNFIDEAFTEEEQAAINTTTVINKDNPSYGTDVGNNTEDKVYLLSIEEASNVEYGFDSTFNDDSDTRDVKNTDYAKLNVKSTSGNFRYAGNGYWWLRTSGDDSFSYVNASYVNNSGQGNYSGHRVDIIINGVRPALHINLASSVWEKAGTVTSNGEVVEPGATSTPSQAPTTEPTVTPSVTTKPNDGESGSVATNEPTPTNTPDIAPTQQPTQAPVVTQPPVVTLTPTIVPAPVQTIVPVDTSKADEVKTFKLSSLKIKKNATKITGKVSVSKATVKIKVGSKSWKKATVKGKKFTLKTAKLKKNTKVQIKVSKKGYKTLKKSYKVK